MKVLDASFLIDYEHGVEAAKEYLLDHADEEFVVPAPVHTEYLLGEVHADGGTDLPAARAELTWATIRPATERTSNLASEVADEIDPQGPRLTAVDALVAGTGREVGAPVVAGDGDLTHPETKVVLDVEEYR